MKKIHTENQQNQDYWASECIVCLLVCQLVHGLYLITSVLLFLEL